MKGIQQNRLEAYFAKHVEGAEPPIRFSLITGGRSNLTYLVEDAKGEKRVLRRPPTGAVLAIALIGAFVLATRSPSVGQPDTTAATAAGTTDATEPAWSIELTEPVTEKRKLFVYTSVQSSLVVA